MLFRSPAPAKQNTDGDRTGLNAQAPVGTAGTAGEAPTFVPTFENMYQSRAAKDRVEPDVVDAEPNPRKQGDNDSEK